jgi:hypothetical protein
MENVNIERDVLIGICEDAVVPAKDWDDRDSYSAQVQLERIYRYLTAGASYTTSVEGDRTIWIDFHNITEQQREVLYQRGLPIGNREDYFETHDEDSEMFDCAYPDSRATSYSGYLPTQARLDSCYGGDWY